MENKRDIIYDLIEHLGGHENDIVLMNLIKWLTTDQIVEFVDDFCRHHNVTIPGYEEYELCMDCQNTYEANEEHLCDEEEDTETDDATIFFSARIPEC